MARVPTWAELRIDVTKLIHAQKECYRSVHDMLDRAIPEIDRKLSILNGSKSIQQHHHHHHHHQITKSPSYPNFSRHEQPARLQPYTQQSKPQQQQQQQQQLQQRPIPVHKQHQQQPRQSKKVPSPTPAQPTILEVPTKIASNKTFKKPHSQSNGYNTKQERNGATNGYHALTNGHREQTIADCNHYETIDYTKATNGYRKGPIDYRKKSIGTDHNHNQIHQKGPIDYRKKAQTERRKVDHVIRDEHNGAHYEEIQYPVIREKPNLDELVHLRPLAKPLSYYLKKNRPDLVIEADRRVMYLKKKAERRRHIAASRSVNALDLIRSSSRSSSHRGISSVRSLSRTVSRDNMHPNYNVKCRLSEQEMKRLTARTYNRLPEVKKQRNEQVTKHMKVQNYKNKMEYGRKLLENRRQGIINYPLRSYEDSSNMSSQEESFTNSLDQSADALKFEQYY